MTTEVATDDSENVTAEVATDDSEIVTAEVATNDSENVTTEAATDDSEIVTAEVATNDSEIVTTEVTADDNETRGSNSSDFGEATSVDESIMSLGSIEDELAQVDLEAHATKNNLEDEVPQAVTVDVYPTLLSFSSSKEGDKNYNKNCWSEVEGSAFKVRGKNYLRDKKKYQSGENIFKARGVDVLLSDEWGPTAIGREHPGILNGKLRDCPTFLINFRFGWGVLVLYFEIPEQYLPSLSAKYGCGDHGSGGGEQDTTLSPHDQAVHDFLFSDDELKNSKLKLIPKVVEGNIIVRKLIGKPVIIGRKLPIQYVYEPEDTSKGHSAFLEADLDIGSSSKRAKKIIDSLRKHMKSLTVDVGFVVECSSVEQLPERMLASVRIHHIDPSYCTKL